MELFAKDSVKDLICRGYSREEILKRTNTDVGYNACNYKTQLAGIDRNLYKLEYVKMNIGLEKYLQALDLYASGRNKQDVLNIFEIDNTNLVNLKWFFKELGLRDAYLKADLSRRQINMKEGLKEKYGVDNAFRVKEFTEKAIRTKRKNRETNI